MAIADTINKLLGRATPFKRNALGDIEVLIHKDARRYAPHGFVIASNKAQQIKRGEVAVVFPDLEDAAPDLTYQVMTDLFEAMHAQGWVPHHIAAWGTVRLITAADQPVKRADEPTEGFQSAGFGAAPVVDLDDVPAYLRRQAEDATNAATPSGVLTFPRRDPLSVKHGTGADEEGIKDPTVIRLVEAANKRVAHLDDMTRNASKIRFEQIGSNGLTTGKSYEFISDKLSAAVGVILQAHREAESEASAAQS